MGNIQIDEEFRAVLPPLDQDERDGLEKMLLADGCRDPLVTWRGVLVDGHNRYEICKKHGLPFDVVEKEFEDRASVRIWMRETQSSKRNLTPAWRIELALANKADLAKVGATKRAETLKQNKSDRSPVLSQIDKTVPAPKHNTQADIAAKANVSTGQVGMAEVVRREAPELWEKAKSGEVTVSGAYKTVNKQKKIKNRLDEIAEQRESIANGDAQLPAGEFEVIVMDPPFAKDAVLFLWTTHQFIWDAKALMDSWGFAYKATIVWDKEKMGMGAWFRMQCEFCLLGIRGKPTWQNTTWRDVIREPRRQHSRKPDAFYQMVEECTVGRRLEMFSREQRDGWGAFGNDTAKF